MVSHVCRLVYAAVLALSAAASLPASAEELPNGYAAEVATLMPAVVAIQTVATTSRGRMYFDGSGFIIDPSGVIVTNRHVIAGAFEITARIPEIGRVPARPLYVSGLIDLALLKVDVGRKLPSLKLGDSDSVRVGDEVLLLGNPLGVGLSVSHGVISALNRDIGESMYDHFFQTDGALNHGNSGGPLVNLAGEVIGINTGLDSSPGNTGSIGIGFSMPINDAKFVIGQFLRNGHVVAGTVGVQGQRISDELADALGMDHAHGLVVTWVDPAGPAAGLIEVGDIVVTVEGRDATDGPAMARLVASAPPGRPLHVTLLRNGTERAVDVMVKAEAIDPKVTMSLLGHAPADSRPFATPSEPGMTLGEVTGEAEKGPVPRAAANGVAVKSVDSNGAAAKLWITAGDVILAVGHTPVSEPADVTRELRAAVAHGHRFAAVLVRSEKGPRWVALPVEADH